MTMNYKFVLINKSIESIEYIEFVEFDIVYGRLNSSESKLEIQSLLQYINELDYSSEVEPSPITDLQGVPDMFLYLLDGSEIYVKPNDGYIEAQVAFEGDTEIKYAYYDDLEYYILVVTFIE